MVAVAVINKYVVVGTFCGHHRELQGNIDLTVVFNCRLYQPLTVGVFYQVTLLTDVYQDQVRVTCVVARSRPILNGSLLLSKDLSGSVAGGWRMKAVCCADSLQLTEKTHNKCPSEASFKATTTTSSRLLEFSFKVVIFVTVKLHRPNPGPMFEHSVRYQAIASPSSAREECYVIIVIFLSGLYQLTCYILTGRGMLRMFCCVYVSLSSPSSPLSTRH